MANFMAVWTARVIATGLFLLMLSAAVFEPYQPGYTTPLVQYGARFLLASVFGVLCAASWRLPRRG